MSLAQILDHLKLGDVIIVRGGSASFRMREAVLPVRAGGSGNTGKSRKLLRTLIAVRRTGGEK